MMCALILFSGQNHTHKQTMAIPGQSTKGYMKHVHWGHSHHASLPVFPNHRACVDYHAVAFYTNGQCCSNNPMKEEAQLVNPPIGYKYWKNVYGKKVYKVTCKDHYS